MNENQKDLMESLEKASKAFNEIHDEIENQSEQYWNNLSKEDQLKVFCAISRRIFKAELEEHRSYRGILYDVFEWGPEAYAPAQIAGYLAIHNAIMPYDHDKKLLTKFCDYCKIDDIETKIEEFLHGR